MCPLAVQSATDREDDLKVGLAKSMAKGASSLMWDHQRAPFGESSIDNDMVGVTRGHVLSQSTLTFISKKILINIQQ